MKIAVIGLGKMGTVVEKIADERGHDTITIDPKNPKATFSSLSAAPLSTVDCCIEFSHPSAVMQTIETVIDAGVTLIVGTTGWDEHLAAVKSQVSSKEGALLYSSNFSIGVQIFAKIVEHAARIMNAFEQYDVCGFEAHHNQKADSPSGTARTLADIVLSATKRKDSLLFDSPNRKIERNELQFSSVRCGTIPGTHSILFDSSVDTISLSHTARSREGFALGAVLAAEWMQGKSGFFTIDDLISEAIG